MEQIYLKPGIHKRELSKQLNISMPSIDHALKKLKNITIEQKSGNRINYFLNYSKTMLTPALYAVEYSRFEKLPAKIKISVKEFLKELEEKPTMVIIFGSYAEGTYTKESDIDIMLVFQKTGKEKMIENTAKNVSMRTGTTISPVYIDYDSFRESFHDPRKEFFKKMKENKMILEGVEWWRELKDEEA